MAWNGILGHDRVAERFRTAMARNRLASTFLFVGPEGIGKTAFAVRFAQALLCEAAPGLLEACGNCPACQQVMADTHPDLERIQVPAGKSVLPVELFIGDKEHRMRAGLCHNISLKPSRGGRRIAIIEDADVLNIESANCLLKTLEEPPPMSVLILIGTSEQRQLPTIRSRCQVIRFEPLAEDEVARILLEQKVVDSEASAAELAAQADGSLQRARELADPGLAEFEALLQRQLSQRQFPAQALGKEVREFVEQVGPEGSLRRERMQWVARVGSQIYRHEARQLALEEPDQPLVLERLLRCVDRCLEVEGQVAANANLAALIECWLDDLLAIRR